MLKTICYKSEANDSLSIQDIKSLFKQTKQSNDSRNIHGVLVIHKNMFFQVLEGEEHILDTLFEKIKVDNRHHNIEEILNAPINVPLFKDFGVGYTIIDNIKALYTLQQYTNFLNLETTDDGNNHIFFDIITNLITEDA